MSGNGYDSYVATVFILNIHTVLRVAQEQRQNCFCPTRSSLSTDLVSVASSQFFSYVQAAAVLYEAAVGPVRVVETEGATAVAVPGVLDGDGAGHHGDDAATACILLSLRGRKTLEILKKADYFYPACFYN